MAATADVVLVDGLRDRARQNVLDPIHSLDGSPQDSGRTSLEVAATDNEGVRPDETHTRPAPGQATGRSAVTATVEKVAVSLRRELSLLRHAFREFEVIIVSCYDDSTSFKERERTAGAPCQSNHKVCIMKFPLSCVHVVAMCVRRTTQGQR